MESVDRYCPAEIPPPRRRLSSPKPERIRAKGKAQKRMAPADRSLATYRVGKPLPVTPKARESAEVQPIATSSVYSRGEVKRSKGNAPTVVFKRGAFHMRAAKNGWKPCQSLVSAIEQAKALEAAIGRRVLVCEALHRPKVGSTIRLTWWIRPIKDPAESPVAKPDAEARKAKPSKIYTGPVYVSARNLKA